jgi:hypothetical protein
VTAAALPFTVVDVAQRSPEWFAARCGRVTSSVVKKVFARGKRAGEESIERRDLRIRLACERLTGVSQDDGDTRTAAMQRGVDREDDARMAYEVYSGRVVQQVGFIAHPALLVGASLDGYVGAFEGIQELKVPKTATHLEYLMGLRADPSWLPEEYLPQIRHELWVSCAQWCDFVSFDDRMPVGLQLLVRRIHRDEVDIPAHALAVTNFLSEVERQMDAIRGLAA